MSEEVQQPYDLDEFICLIGEKPNLSQPNPLSIEDYLKVAKQNNENNKTETILKTWENQQTAERKLRKTYANCFMWFLGLQLLVLNIIFILIGSGTLKYEQWTVNIFIISVFGEIIGVVSIIVKNLFTSTNKEMIDLIKEQK